MAATVTLDQTINWVRPYLNWANLSIGAAGEPAISSANLILQTLVGPPFKWPWNRGTAKFQTIQGVQDYTMNITQFGYMEAVSAQMCGVITSVVANGTTAVFQAVNNFAGGSLAQEGAFPIKVYIEGCTTTQLNGAQVMTAATPTSFTINTTVVVSESESGALALAGKIFPLELKWGAGTEANEQARPQFIFQQESNESGVSFTLRLLPVPDTTYQVRLIYQLSPLQFFDTSATWGIPDQLQYIYNYLFLFLMMDYFDDPRAARYHQLGIAALLSRADGLELSDRNLFLGNWLDLMREEQSSTESTQQGTQARGL
jgi:hypothetical protein